MSSSGDDAGHGRIKCVVWDLDNTLWDGVLLEGDRCEPFPAVLAAIGELDRRGILQSIAGRNDADAAAAKLAELGLDDMFLYPRIGWSDKSESVAAIARRLNFGIDALAFVDDQPFEREEVRHHHPEVMCLDPAELDQAMDHPWLTPRFITADSARRRSLYQAQVMREAEEERFGGSNTEFLQTLGMRFQIRHADRTDLQRAEELTVRTNQLNSTGRTYSYDELDALRTSPEHQVLVAEMEDRFGSYGVIGLALVECGAPAWHLRLLLMSCRTMSRGVGTVLLGYIMRQARDHADTLLADFVETGRNRMMQITYAFAGFVETERQGDRVLLRSDLTDIQELPSYVALDVPVDS